MDRRFYINPAQVALRAKTCGSAVLHSMIFAYWRSAQLWGPQTKLKSGGPIILKKIGAATGAAGQELHLFGRTMAFVGGHDQRPCRTRTAELRSAPASARGAVGPAGDVRTRPANAEAAFTGCRETLECCHPERSEGPGISPESMNGVNYRGSSPKTRAQNDSAYRKSSVISHQS
jgi:hypothetical protein